MGIIQFSVLFSEILSSRILRIFREEKDNKRKDNKRKKPEKFDEIFWHDMDDEKFALQIKTLERVFNFPKIYIKKMVCYSSVNFIYKIPQMKHLGEHILLCNFTIGNPVFDIAPYEKWKTHWLYEEFILKINIEKTSLNICKNEIIYNGKDITFMIIPPFKYKILSEKKSKNAFGLPILITEIRIF